jgi:hypothetical protein
VRRTLRYLAKLFLDLREVTLSCLGSPSLWPLPRAVVVGILSPRIPSLPLLSLRRLGRLPALTRLVLSCPRGLLLLLVLQHEAPRKFLVQIRLRALGIDSVSHTFGG